MNPKNTSSGVFGEPEEWEFDYPFKTIKRAFWLWSMSNFTRLPNQDEVMSYDDKYFDDMQLAMTIYSHQNNNSYVMEMFQNLYYQKYGKHDIDENSN